MKFTTIGVAIRLWLSRIWQRTKFWAITRAQFVAGMWLSVGAVACVWIYHHHEQNGEIITGLQSFADPTLVIVLVFGAALLPAAINMLGLLSFREKSSTDEWRTVALDEVSDAATHFSAIWLLLLAMHAWLGTFDGSKIWWLLVMIVFAIALCRYDPKINNSDLNDYKVTIESPIENARVPMHATFRGTASAKPPSNFRLWLIRRWDNHEFEFYPVSEIYLTRPSEELSFNWAVNEAFVGGIPGKGEKRHFEVWLVGPEGHRLMTHWSAWNKYCNSIRDELVERNINNIKILSQAIPDITDDMKLLATRTVVRS